MMLNGLCQSIITVKGTIRFAQITEILDQGSELIVIDHSLKSYTINTRKLEVFFFHIDLSKFLF